MSSLSATDSLSPNLRLEPISLEETAQTDAGLAASLKLIENEMDQMRKICPYHRPFLQGAIGVSEGFAKGAASGAIRGVIGISLSGLSYMHRVRQHYQQDPTRWQNVARLVFASLFAAGCIALDIYSWATAAPLRLIGVAVSAGISAFIGGIGGGGEAKSYQAKTYQELDEQTRLYQDHLNAIVKLIEPRKEEFKLLKNADQLEDMRNILEKLFNEVRTRIKENYDRIEPEPIWIDRLKAPPSCSKSKEMLGNFINWWRGHREEHPYESRLEEIKALEESILSNYPEPLTMLRF